MLTDDGVADDNLQLRPSMPVSTGKVIWPAWTVKVVYALQLLLPSAKIAVPR